MKSKTGVLKAVIASVVGLMSVQAQADIIKNAVRLGAFPINTTDTYVPLTTTGDQTVIFSGSGKFTIYSRCRQPLCPHHRTQVGWSRLSE